MGIKAQHARSYTVTTMDPGINSRLKNILDEDFNSERPDAVWCSDITYIWTFEELVYLTSILDLYFRKITAWVLSETLEARWVVEAVKKAKERRNVDKPLAMHSDRGIQYVSSDYQEIMQAMR